jgi:hypothetical protein
VISTGIDAGQACFAGNRYDVNLEILSVQHFDGRKRLIHSKPDSSVHFCKATGCTRVQDIPRIIRKCQISKWAVAAAVAESTLALAQMIYFFWRS